VLLLGWISQTLGAECGRPAPADVLSLEERLLDAALVIYGKYTSITSGNVRGSIKKYTYTADVYCVLRNDAQVDVTSPLVIEFESQPSCADTFLAQPEDTEVVVQLHLDATTFRPNNTNTQAADYKVENDTLVTVTGLCGYQNVTEPEGCDASCNCPSPSATAETCVSEIVDDETSSIDPGSTTTPKPSDNAGAKPAVHTMMPAFAVFVIALLA